MTSIQTVIKLLGELKDRCDGTDKITPEDMQTDIDTILIYAREADIPPMLEVRSCPGMKHCTCESLE